MEKGERRVAIKKLEVGEDNPGRIVKEMPIRPLENIEFRCSDYYFIEKEV